MTVHLGPEYAAPSATNIFRSPLRMMSIRTLEGIINTFDLLMKCEIRSTRGCTKFRSLFVFYTNHLQWRQVGREGISLEFFVPSLPILGLANIYEFSVDESIEEQDIGRSPV
jgi:hypothetical protein